MDQVTLPHGSPCLVAQSTVCRDDDIRTLELGFISRFLPVIYVYAELSLLADACLYLIDPLMHDTQGNNDEGLSRLTLCPKSHLMASNLILRVAELEVLCVLTNFGLAVE